MCIAVFAWKSHPLYPFLLLLNRDEYYSRPTTPLGWWEDGSILGGRDELAGGTWLACSRDGRIAFLTNVRENRPPSQGSRSRGDLPVRFLKSRKTPKEFAEELAGEADHFNGFNLIVADFTSMSMVYITNRPKDDGLNAAEVSPGVHVLSNARLDTPWPKARRLRHRFEDALAECGEGEVSVTEISETLMRDGTKEEGELPGIYAPEIEYLLSSIFVDGDTPLGRYGTRSTAAVAVRTSGLVCFYERYLEKDAWKDATVKYDIETGKIVS